MNETSMWGKPLQARHPTPHGTERAFSDRTDPGPGNTLIRMPDSRVGDPARASASDPHRSARP